MRRFELVEGTSSKFWEVSCEDKSLTISFGKIGTKGQTQVKDLASAQAAEKELRKLVVEKTKKGYVEKATSDCTQEASAEDTGVELATKFVVEDAIPVPEIKTKTPISKASTTQDAGWLDADNGYWLTLKDNKLACRKGLQPLASVPKSVKEGPLVDRLLMLKDWLVDHERSCLLHVENWMLRSLPTPSLVLSAVWKDAAWIKALENAVVIPLGADGHALEEGVGFLRGVSDKGLGVVNLDGETVWLNAKSIAIPHPILIDELDDLRSLASELSFNQGVSQLFREVFPLPENLSGQEHSVHSYAEGKFDQLNHCLGHCRKLGYRVRGGCATIRVWEQGRVFEARYWIGMDDPTCEAWTGDLTWVDEKDQAIVLSKLTPVAYSEGMRMASSIYAARKIEQEASNG